MHLSEQDLITGLISLLAILIALLCIELAVKKKSISKLAGRKLLHIYAICTCAWSIRHFENRLLLASLFLAFFFILLGVIQKGWMQVNEYRSYGIAHFSLAFSFLLFVPVFPTFVIVYAVLILGICDAFAGIFGIYFGKKKIMFLYENKSWAGFAAFFFSAMLVTTIYFNDYTLKGLIICATLSLLPAITELFSYRGSDNFTVPVFTAVWASLILKSDQKEIVLILTLIPGFTMLAVLAVYKKWLTLKGAVAACWMALILYTTGGEKAFIAPGIFLVAGSLLSKLNRHQNEKEGRSAIQVFANGIVGIIMMIGYGLSHENIYLISAVVSFCISMADSVSSETGIYFKGSTYDILSLKKTLPGISGGISAAGSFAGLAGAGLLSLTTGFSFHFNWTLILWITLAGFAGMITDSVMGSLLQVKFKDESGRVSDEAAPGAIQVKGYGWCNNDTVNILSNLLITLVFIYFFSRIT